MVTTTTKMEREDVIADLVQKIGSLVDDGDFDENSTLKEILSRGGVGWHGLGIGLLALLERDYILNRKEVSKDEYIDLTVGQVADYLLKQGRRT